MTGRQPDRPTYDEPDTRFPWLDRIAVACFCLGAVMVVVTPALLIYRAFQ